MRALKLSGQVIALATVAGLLGLLIWRVTHKSAPPKIGGPAPTPVGTSSCGAPSASRTVASPTHSVARHAG
jgi:Flp pilus assembly protein CpaB